MSPERRARAGIEETLTVHILSDSLGETAPVESLTALREFNLANRDRNAIRYEQAQLDISDQMDVEKDRPRWRADRDKDLRLSRTEGIDAALEGNGAVVECALSILGAGRLEVSCVDISESAIANIRQRFPDAVSIFIVPPNVDALRARLAGRGQDAPEVVQRRMRDARSEISHWDEFDHVVINDNFEAALADLHAIVREGAPLRQNQQQLTEEILADFLGSG